jgi:predicted nucleotidyltransferase
VPTEVSTGMDEALREESVARLRAAGARFAFLHGSRAAGTARADSDADVAAWWDGAAPAPWDVALPHGVDLLVLNGAPLELAGRVALRDALLFDDDPPARVRWQAQTRLVYLDEGDRQRGLDRLFFEERARGR